MMLENFERSFKKSVSQCKLYLSSFLVLSLVSGCVHNTGSAALPLEKVSFKDLVGWEREDYVTLLSLMWRQCHRLSQLPLEADLGGDVSIPTGHQAGSWSSACAALPQSEQVTREEARTYFERWFSPYLVKKTAFYTGYYEPEIEASLEHVGAYQYPIYHKPADLLRTRDENGKVVFGRDVDGALMPYDDRAMIDRGVLAGQHLEVAWLKSPVDVFFLQIQGSGRLRLPDGQTLRVTYDGQNGQKYIPIGQILVQQGALDAQNVSEASIRQWLISHPDQRETMLEKNPNYVFFRLVEHPSTEGPIGAFGLPLITGRSLAVDRHVIPFGALIWAQTSMVDPLDGRAVAVLSDNMQKGLWHHLVFAQDMANDIHGGVRAEIFTGWGEKAHILASHLHDNGQMFILLPKEQNEGNVFSPQYMPSEAASSASDEGVHPMNSKDISAFWARQKTY